jgi:DNA polymerase V
LRFLLSVVDQGGKISLQPLSHPIGTSQEAEGLSCFKSSATGRVSPAATQDTRVIVHTANRLLKELFREGYRYQKCGIQLNQIQPAAMPGQRDLFGTEAFDPAESGKLMQTVDRINRRYPKGISIAAAGFEQSWKPKAERISKRYTTDWRELVIAKC